MNMLMANRDVIPGDDKNPKQDVGPGGTKDTYSEVYELEIRHRGLEFIRNHLALPSTEPLDRALAVLYKPMHSAEIGNQFGAKIVRCFFQPEPSSALDEFRAVSPTTVDEEMVSLLNDEQFRGLYLGLRQHLSDIKEEVSTAVKERLKAMRVADYNQFSCEVTRSLDCMIKSGMTMYIDTAGYAAVMRAYGLSGQGILPITEYIKNERILSVSGFEGSKISLAIHDFMDHIWTFDKIRSAGLIDRYSELFESVGNPQLTDIFRREGEMVASIAFGVRLFQTAPHGFVPLMKSSHILERLEQMFLEGRLESRHFDAYRTVKSLEEGSLEWQSLGFVFSNYITELNEQRRKHGKIKQRNTVTKQLIGELDPLSPDYLCFFIDAHHEIVSPGNKHRNDLYRIHILFEEYLHAIASGQNPSASTSISLERLREADFRGTELPADRLRWMLKNYGYTATRSATI